MQLGDLGTHLNAQLGVQVGERLVHQEDLGLTNDGAAEGDALTLTTGQSGGLTIQQSLDAQDRGGFLNAAIDVRLGHLAQLQTESHVVVNGHVRIQSVALENHRDVAILRGNMVDELVVDIEFATGDVFQAGDHAQGGGLTTAGRTNQNDEFLVFNLEVEIADRDNITRVDLVNVAKRKTCHSCCLLNPNLMLLL